MERPEEVPLLVLAPAKKVRRRPTLRRPKKKARPKLRPVPRKQKRKL